MTVLSMVCYLVQTLCKYLTSQISLVLTFRCIHTPTAKLTNSFPKTIIYIGNWMGLVKKEQAVIPISHFPTLSETHGLCSLKQVNETFQPKI